MIEYCSSIKFCSRRPVAVVGRVGSGSQFYVNHGSGWLDHLHNGSGAVGSKNWTHVQLWSPCSSLSLLATTKPPCSAVS